MTLYKGFSLDVLPHISLYAANLMQFKINVIDNNVMYMKKGTGVCSSHRQFYGGKKSGTYVSLVFEEQK
jgi:hypothetical protein